MRKGYSMVELIFVMVIIGIIGGFAIPRMSSSVDLAKTISAKDILLSVQIAVKVERQKRISKGDFTPITSLSSGDYLFNYFSPDINKTKRPILQNPLESCSEMNCWELLRDSSLSQDKPETYIYYYGPHESETCSFKLINSEFVGHCPTINSYL